jgi:hypothetical protein
MQHGIGTYNIEREERVKLDESMDIPEDDGYGKEYDVLRMPSEQANQLHHLRKCEHEY